MRYLGDVKLFFMLGRWNLTGLPWTFRKCHVHKAHYVHTGSISQDVQKSIQIRCFASRDDFQYGGNLLSVGQ